MVRIQQQIELIEQVRRKIDAAEKKKDWKRRNDLVKYKRRLILDLEEAEKLLGLV